MRILFLAFLLFVTSAFGHDRSVSASLGETDLEIAEGDLFIAAGIWWDTRLPKAWDRSNGETIAWHMKHPFYGLKTWEERDLASAVVHIMEHWNQKDLEATRRNWCAVRCPRIQKTCELREKAPARPIVEPKVKYGIQ